MSVKVTLKDNSDKVLAQLKANKKAALTAMGVKAVNLILKQMRRGYSKPIRWSGDLQRDVSYEVENSGPDTVDVGNTLKYAPFVHEGHAGHSVRLKDGSWVTLPGGHTKGKPYIRDALTGESNKKQLQKAAESALKKGFE